MNVGICLSVFGSLEGMEKKMAGHLDRTTIALLIEKYSKSFDKVFVFSHDSKDFGSWLPENVEQVRVYNKLLYFLFGWLVVLHAVVRKDIRFISVQTGSALPAVFMVNKLTSAKVMLQYDNMFFMTASNPVKRAAYKLLEKFLHNFADYFVISSKEVMDFVGDRQGMLDLKKGIILDELNPEKVRASPLLRKIGRPAVIYIGRLSEEKDPITAIKAYRLAKEKVPGLNLIICGDGNLLEECKRVSDSGVHFLGFVKDIPGLLKGVDIFVLSSTYDASPKAMLEAMAMGKPCIATRVGGVPDFIDDSCGALVEPKDPASIAEKIVHLLKNPREAKRLGENGRKRVLQLHDLRKNIDRQIEMMAKELGHTE